jgi:hypothetical protein
LTHSPDAAATEPVEPVHIDTAEQYREAVAEVQRLQSAREGTPDFARRQALRGALHDYERRHQTRDCHPGRPG